VAPGTYGQEYYYHAPQFQKGLARRGQLQVQHLRQLLRRTGAEAPRSQETGLRLLELGCNSGYFVEAALAAGFEAYGVDVSSQAVAAGQARGLGPRLIAADARQPLTGLQAREFHLVAAWELLEHMDAPAEFLRTAAQHLAPGGLVIGSCPNAESAWLWALGPDWHGYDIPQYHRCYLTAAGFYAAAQAADLEPLYCGSLNEPNGLFLLKNTATAGLRKLHRGPAPIARAALALALALPHWLLERLAGHIPGFEGETLLFAARKRA
jgi:predicted TPR repeat methyltransferase